MSKKILLTSDGAINIVLGATLLSFPLGVGDLLGMPPTDNHFYTTILGGVLFGIGLALFIERNWSASGIRGLGLAGAIAINLCGGGVLLIWLLISPINLSVHGRLILWLVALLVLGIGVVELITKSWKIN
jgi:uncharacterized membrane protein